MKQKALLHFRPTPVFDTFWRFAAARQEIYLKRVRASEPPWTDDAILGTFKFTNAYRASDRVSQYLIRQVIYDKDRPADDTVLRILIFKLFNKIETWELLERKLGEITYATFKPEAYSKVLDQALHNGQSIYSAAYIMAPGTGVFALGKKHQSHLQLVRQMMKDRLASKLARAPTMAAIYDLLIGYPMVGRFLAYQLATDINYSEVTNFSEMEFVMAGPGAISGIYKCFGAAALKEPERLIRDVTDCQMEEFRCRGIEFSSLWGRPLQLIDVQNLFCEVDKYARIAHPNVQGKSGRQRIKQKYSAPKPMSAPWFPPKWRINKAVTQWLRGVNA